MKTHLIALTAALVLGGCAFSGYDADSQFSCKAPDGVPCMSVSGVYANAKQNNLPGQRIKHDVPPESSASTAGPTAERVVQRDYGAPETNFALGTTEKTSPKTMAAMNSGVPLRTRERILRVWLAPFEDQEGDLHDQKYFYVTVNSGSWTIEANRMNIRKQYQQVFPLSKNNPANKRTDEPSATPAQQASQVISSVPQSGGEEPQQ